MGYFIGEMVRRLTIPDICPFCKRKIIIGLYGHLEQCAKEEQKRLDREHSKKFNKKYLTEKQMKKLLAHR